MYTVIVIVVVSRVKTVESISVIPSSFSTVHVNDPQIVRLLTLLTSALVQLKTSAAYLMLYVRAGEVNFVVLIFRVSERHGFTTTRLKF